MAAGTVRAPEVAPMTDDAKVDALEARLRSKLEITTGFADEATMVHELNRIFRCVRAPARPANPSSCLRAQSQERRGGRAARMAPGGRGQSPRATSRSQFPNEHVARARPASRARGGAPRGLSAPSEA